MQKTDAEGHAERLMGEGHEVHVRGKPLLASLLATIASQRAELEAARAVVEHVREARGVCLWRHASADGWTPCGRCDDCTTGRLVDNYDAAKAGKAVE